MVKIQLGRILMLLLFISAGAYASDSLEIDLFGPRTLKSRRKPYTFKLNEIDSSQKYIIELQQGNGRDIRLRNCDSLSRFRRFFCRINNKIKGIYYRYNRPRFAKVFINGQEVVSRKEFNWKVGYLSKEIDLKEKNKIKVKVRGRRSSKIKIRIFKTSTGQSPIADIQVAPTGLDGKTFLFNGSQSTDDGQIQEYNWDFGDGNSGEGVMITHQYQNPGEYDVKLRVIDDTGLTGEIRVPVLVEANNPPVAIAKSNIETGEAPLMVMFDASSSSDSDGDFLTYSWDFGDGNSSQGVVTSHLYVNIGSYSVTLTVTDAKGASSQSFLTINATDVVLPPDPNSIAPDIQLGDNPSLLSSISFLYESDPPVQRNVSPNIIEPSLVSWVRGKIVDKNNNPVSRVKVSVLDHPEFGFTYSRADGMYDLAVNGGMTYVMDYSNASILPVQRQIEINALASVFMEDVFVTELDSKVLPIVNNSADPQLMVGSTLSDQDGARTGVLYIPPSTSGEIVLPDGTTQTLPNMNLRITEYTVGENGPRAMPGTLPPTTHYTYAMELSVDEAIALGSNRIEFNRPLSYYVDNFLNLPPGSIIPFGFYNTDSGQWEANDNGIVIKVLSVNNGVAELDLDNSGQPNSVLETTFSINAQERSQIAQRYGPGESFWRVQVSHFSAWDLNLLQQLANNSPTDNNFNRPQDQNNNQCMAGGSFFEIEPRTFGESFPVYGTPFFLTYKSERTPGYLPNSTLNLDLSERLNEAGAAYAKMSVQGVEIETLATSQQPSYDPLYWDGKDAFGRSIYGLQKVEVEYASVASSDYLVQQCSGLASPDQCVNNRLFSRFYSGTLFEGRNVDTRTNIRKRHFYLGVLDWREQGFGGWSLDIHHSFNPIANRLYLGTGQTRIEQTSHIDPIVNNCFLEPNGCSGFNDPNGDGGPAIDAFLFNPLDIKYLGDGSLLVAEVSGAKNVIRKITTDGIINTIAGQGSDSDSENRLAQDIAITAVNALAILPNQEILFSDSTRLRKIGLDGRVTTVAGQKSEAIPRGDGGPAKDATLEPITDLALGPDGSIFVSGTNTVRRIFPNGTIDTYAGIYTGNGVVPTDGVLATEARFQSITSIAVDINGYLYISSGTSLFSVRPDGILQQMIGALGLNVDTGDGGEARLAGTSGIYDIVVDRDINIYIANFRSNERTGVIRRITPDGFINSFVGAPTPAPADFQNSKGTPAKDYLSKGVFSMGLDGNGRLVFSEQYKISRVDNLFAASLVDDFYRIPSEDESEIYIFDKNGRHLETLHARTRATKFQFVYTNNLLSEILDGDGNSTRIIRDSSGGIEKIVSHYGVETVFQTNSDGYLSQMQTPENDSYEFIYDSLGLLTRINKPEGAFTEITYDEGLLVTDTDAIGGFFRFSEDASGQVINVQTSEGRLSQLQTIRLSQNSRTTLYTKEDETLIQTDFEGINLNRENKNFSLNSFREERTENPFLPTNLMTKNIYAQNSASLYVLSQNREVNYVDPNNPEISEFTITDQYLVNDQFLTTEVYESLSNERIVTTPEGRTYKVRTDDQERVIRVEIEGVLPIQVIYDSNGRTQQIVQGDRTTQFRYDESGYLSEIENALGEATRFINDPNGRVLTQILDDDRQIDFTYDGRGNLISVQPPGKSAHQMAYNLQNLLTDYIPPTLSGLSTPLSFRYNLDKDLIGIDRADDKSIDFAINNKRQITSITTNEGVSAYGYDPQNKLLSNITSEDDIRLGFRYNSENIINQYSWDNIGSISLFYDDRFFYTGNTFEGGFFRTGDGLPTTGGFSNLSLTYNTENTLLKSLSFFGLPNDTYSYNDFGEVISYQYNLGGSYFMNYTRDKLGRIIEIKEQTGSGIDTKSYSYDRTGRLIASTDGLGTTSYVYDSNSNIIRVNSPSGTQIGVYDSQDRLTSFGDYRFTYNNHGELTTKTKVSSNELTRYTYDSFNNLKKVQLPSGKNIEYQVDGLNRRIRRTTDGGTSFETYFYKDQLNIVSYRRADGRQARFFYGVKTQVPEAMEIDGIYYRIISDHLGSVREVRSQNGVLVQQVKYDAYGKVTLDTNPGFQPFGYAGGLYDHETGLVRFGARDYDANVMRWTAKDPILFNSGIANLYSYAKDDPINFIDITGEKPTQAGPQPPITINPEYLPNPGPNGDKDRPNDDNNFIPPNIPPEDVLEEIRRQHPKNGDKNPATGTRGLLPQTFIQPENNCS